MNKTLFLTVSICILSLFTIMTHNRNQVWRSDVTLWQDTVNKSPLKPRPRLNLGVALLKAGRYDESLTELQHASMLAMRPGIRQRDRDHTRQFADMNVIAILLRNNHYYDAEALALRLWNDYPGFTGAAIPLSMLAIMRGDFQFAIEIADAGIRESPHWPDFANQAQLWLNRGAAYQLLGDCAQADADYAYARTHDANLQDIPVCIERN